MKTRTKGIIVAVTVAITSTTLIACGFHYKSPQERADYMVEKATKTLELTEPQAAQLNALSQQLLSLREDYLGKREQTHKAMDEILSQPTLDQQRLLAIVHEHTQEINQKAPELIASVANFYDELTPEQQAQLREKFREHRTDAHHHFH